MKKRIKIQGFLIFAAVIALIIFYKFIFPAAGAFNIIFFISGIVLVLLGYLLRISARGFKAKLNPDGKTLITQGPYALTRNPMYLGTLFIGTGICLALFRWWVILVFLAVYLSIYLGQIKREEAILSERFGGEFKDYCAATPKYFPLTKKLLSMHPKAYLDIQWRQVKGELFSLAWTLIFIALAQTGRRLFLK